MGIDCGPYPGASPEYVAEWMRKHSMEPVPPKPPAINVNVAPAQIVPPCGPPIILPPGAKIEPMIAAPADYRVDPGWRYVGYPGGWSAARRAGRWGGFLIFLACLLLGMLLALLIG